MSQLSRDLHARRAAAQPKLEIPPEIAKKLAAEFDYDWVFDEDAELGDTGHDAAYWQHVVSKIAPDLFALFAERLTSVRVRCDFCNGEGEVQVSPRECETCRRCNGHRTVPFGDGYPALARELAASLVPGRGQTDG